MKQIMKNQIGFTFIELVIVCAVSAALVLGAVQFFTNKNKETMKVQAALESTLDGLTFDERMRTDLFETKYSFNSLLISDDNGRLFFDYLSDGRCDSNCDRKLTLTKPKIADNYSEEMVFIIKDNSTAVEQLLNPEIAYKYTGSISDSDNNLNFVSLNNGDILSHANYTPWDVSSDRQSRLILVYSPTLVYSSSAVIGKTPGRMIQFLGWLTMSNKNGALVVEKIMSGSKKYFNDKDVRTDKEIASEDDMLKNIPYTSGVGVFVLVAPVKVIRFRVKAVNEGGKIIGKLLREELQLDHTFSQSVVSSNVESLVFSRETISNSTIDMKINYGK